MSKSVQSLIQKTRFTWESQSVPYRFLAGLTNPQFQRAQLQEVPSLRVRTRITWEPHTITVQSDSLADVTNHGFNAPSSMFTWETQTVTEQTDSLAGLTNHGSTRSTPTQ